MEKLRKEMPGFLSPGKGVPLLLIPEYSGINKDQRIPDRSKTAHRKPPVKCFLSETVSDLILGSSKITTDGDCWHEIKRRLLLGRKVMTNLAY